MPDPALLEVRGLDVLYGGTQVLWDVSLQVGPGEIVAMLGPNGSGKSTVLKAVMGLVARRRGSIRFAGQDLAGVPTWNMAALGLGLVLERRRLFADMTVRENLLMGAFHRGARAAQGQTLAWLENMFPLLRARAGQRAGRMSGGEQQQVAIARGLMARPKLLLMDEPFLGLSPLMVQTIIGVIRRINAEGIAVVFNEQNAQLSFANAHRGYLLESGRVVLEGSGLEMLDNPTIRRVYLGAA